MGNIAVSGDDVLVVDHFGMKVHVIDGRSVQVSGSITIADPVETRYGLSDIEVVGETAWVTNGADGTLVRIDLATREVAGRIPLGDPGPESDNTVAPLFVVDAGEHGLWVSLHHGSLAAPNGSVVRVDPQTEQVTDVVPLGSEPFGGPGAMAAAGDGLWVSVASLESIVRVDPDALTTGPQTRATRGCGSLLALGASVWSGCDDLARFDAETGEVVTRLSLPGQGAITLAAAGGYLVARVRETGQLIVLDTATDEIVAEMELPPAEAAFGVAIAAAADGRIWARAEDELLLVRVVGAP